MVGSILGTFLTGFFLIDTFGTKGVVLLIGTTMAFGATLLGSVWHAVWAGIPLGLCVLAFTPPGVIDVVGKAFPFVNGESFEKIGKRWGIREQPGSPDVSKSDFVWVDESNYYYIKVENQVEGPGDTEKRTLVLDNLIHGYFILNHPERLDYDYEHIYALVAYRAARASGNVIFKPTPEPSKAAAKPLNLPRPGASDNGDQSPQPTEPAKSQDTASKSHQTEEKGGESKSAAPRNQRPSRPAGSRACRPAATIRRQKKDNFPKNPIDDTPRDRDGDGTIEELGSSVPAVEKSEHENALPGRRCLLFSAPHAVCLSAEPPSTSPRSIRP